MTQSPIFIKTFELLKWLLAHTANFPKSERFRMARRLDDAAFRFHDLLVRAAKDRDPRRWLEISAGCSSHWKAALARALNV